MIEASVNPATSAPPVTSLTKTLRDLDSYRAVLERLHIAIEGTEAEE